MFYLLGSIPLGIQPLTGPVGHSVDQMATFAQHAVTRGKPVLQEIGEELDTQSFDFFFSEEFCTPAVELAKLKAAFLMKSPMPLVAGTGGFDGKRYVIESLSYRIVKTSLTGAPVRVEVTISLLEDPMPGGLMGLISSIARTAASAVGSRATSNPDVRK